MSKIRLGLIGCNNQGQEHLHTVNKTKLFDILAVCDVNEQVLRKTGEKFPKLELFNNLENFLAYDLDGYILALPHYVYPQIWPQLMRARKPLLKEKPLGRNLKESRYFLNECQKAGVPLVTAIQRRTHPSYIFLKNKLKAQNIKEISACMHLGFDPIQKPDSWRGDPEKSGGGALLDSGYHLVDLMHFLLGPFHLIQASLWHNGKLSQSGTIDTDVSLIGRCQSTWIRIESRTGGEKDKSGKYTKKETVVVKCEENIYEANRESVKKDGILIFKCSRSWEQAMVDQLTRFAKKIINNKFDSPEVWDQVPAMKVISLAYKLADLDAPFNGGYGNDLCAVCS